MSSRSPEQWLQELTAIMRQTFPDRDYSGTVDLNTTLLTDLGLASIEVVVLAEKLEHHYARKLPFALFLNDLRRSGADDLTLKQLVAFLEKHID